MKIKENVREKVEKSWGLRKRKENVNEEAMKRSSGEGKKSSNFRRVGTERGIFVNERKGFLYNK